MDQAHLAADLLLEGGGRRAAVVEADDDRDVGDRPQPLLGNVLLVVPLLLVDRLAADQRGVLVEDVDPDPGPRLAAHHADVIALAQDGVLALRVDDVAGELLALQGLEHGRRLGEERPVGRAHQQELLLVAHPLRRVDVAGDDRPPVLLARRVGVHDDAGPRRPAHRRVGVAVDAAGAGVDDFLGDLARLVDPHAGEIEREKLLHVLRRIERQEDDLAVDLGAVGHRVAQVVGERRAPQEAAEILGHPAQPGLDRGELELGESIAHDRPARVARAAGDVAGRIFRQVRRLLLGALQDLVHAQHALARAERAANAAHEVVRLHERRTDRAGRHERLGLGRQRPQVDLGLGLAPRERDAGHYFRVRVDGADPGGGRAPLRGGCSGGVTGGGASGSLGAG